MVKVNYLDENLQYIAVILPKYVGKLLTKQVIKKINKSIGYFLFLSFAYSCNNFLMIV